MKMQKNLVARSAALAALMATVATSARAEIDTTAITAEITSAGTACAAIGIAVVVVYVGIKAFKMIRSAL